MKFKDAILLERGTKTQKEFAKELGVRLSTYKGYEKGTSHPNLDQAIKIANKLNVSLDYLFLENGVKINDKEKYHELKSYFFNADEEVFKYAQMYLDFLLSDYNPMK